MKWIGLLAVVAASLLLGGFAIAVQWAWFIEPLGAPPISIPHAIGLAVMIGSLLRGLKREDKVEIESAGDATGAIIASQVSRFAALMIISYPCHLWMVS